MVDPIFTPIAVVCIIGSLVCFILVLIQMFQNDQTGMGIACIVLGLVCGIGGLVAFIVGWMNAAKWNIKNVMLVWTGCFAVMVLMQLVACAGAWSHMAADGF